MESNTRSTEAAPAAKAVPPVGLDRLEAAVQGLAGQDLHGLPDGVAAARVLALRRLLDQLEGQFLRELAGVDGRGAAGTDTDDADEAPLLSTASWLRNRLRLSKGAARHAVHTARALYRGPLAGTAQALAAGDLSAAHAAVLAAGTEDLPPATAAEAEPVLLEAARRLDPPRLRRVISHLRYVTDPEAAEQQRRFERRGLWLSPTWEGMLAVDGLLDPEAGQTLLAALDPLARPSGADDERLGTQRNADALAELARRSLEGGRLPRAGGVRPQLLVTVDLATLLGEPGGLGGELGWAGSVDGEAARRLSCDGALTRVLVTRHHPYHPDEQPDRHHTDGHHPNSHHGGHATSNGRGGDDSSGDLADRHHHSGWDDTSDGHPHDHPGGSQRVDGGWDGATSHPWDGATSDPGWNHRSNGSTDSGAGGAGGLAARLQAALRLLPPALGGAPTQPLELGRTTRVVSPAQRNALTVRDGGCVFPDCGRPQSWCEAHHLTHWLHGGPTDLDNLALVCRVHHRAVHEGGWQLGRDLDGQMTATPPYRRQPGAA